MLFENATSWTKQGDIGESRAIYEYTKLGYIVSRTLFDSAKYDLIVDFGKDIKKIQVKTTRSKTKNGNYKVDLRTTGSGRGYIPILRKDSDYDILFIVNDIDECWSIPATIIGKSSITLGKLYNNYKLSN